jgi:hypothetical protein
MDLKEIGWEDVNWVHLARDSNRYWALVTNVMNRRYRKGGDILSGTVSFSSGSLLFGIWNLLVTYAVSRTQT